MFEMTFGYELELGDVLRSRKVPIHLGKWEYAETDIVNIHGRDAFKAVDPLGLDPQHGGEINIVPGKTVKEVADRVQETIDWFRSQGDKPSASCVNHGHVHVRVVGLRDDIEALKRLTRYIKSSQKIVVERLYQYKEEPSMSGFKTARTYLKWDGGRLMPDWMCDNIIDNAENFDDFIRIQCCGKDSTSRGRPFRYGINTYCMKHTDTIEFRCLRGTLEYGRMYDSLEFARRFLEEGVKENPLPIDELFTETDYKFPLFLYDYLEYKGWEKTKWDKNRGEKKREFINV